jgi:hypothetical protein
MSKVVGMIGALLLILVAGCGGTELCSDGNCICEANVSGCNFHCTKGGCSQQCSSGSNCVVECEKGGCSQSCDANATCDLRCQGGGCTQSCSGNPKCKMSCTPGDCLSN